MVGRALVIGLAMALLGGVERASAEALTDAEAVGDPAQACVPRAECCKVCSRGKACGNSCINRDYQCHQGRGCACDADEVCG
jgi:hypothetical protein